MFRYAFSPAPGFQAITTDIIILGDTITAYGRERISTWSYFFSYLTTFKTPDTLVRAAADAFRMDSAGKVTTLDSKAHDKLHDDKTERLIGHEHLVFKNEDKIITAEDLRNFLEHRNNYIKEHAGEHNPHIWSEGQINHVVESYKDYGKKVKAYGAEGSYEYSNSKEYQRHGIPSIAEHATCLHEINSTGCGTSRPQVREIEGVERSIGFYGAMATLCGVAYYAGSFFSRTAKHTEPEEKAHPNSERKTQLNQKSRKRK